ncbi:MAG: hypothetical protein LBU39_10955 [Desulfobulbaceae bacterium]|jgi:Tfp pilus tip-associated adhesin PilY1|nr:hypothetical protein [Desulfobulbaceae bacterium]
MTKSAVRELCAELGVAVGCAWLFSGLILWPVTNSLATTSGDFASVPLTTTIAVKPNILFVLDNSNSMDEDVDGNAVGSASPNSRSEIARNAIKAIIDKNKDSMRFGLMAYDQQNIRSYNLSNSFYYCSFDPASYQPNVAVTPEIQRDPTINTKRFPNPVDPGNFIYYDTALPMYGATADVRPWFCYSGNYIADDNWANDIYRCVTEKTGTQATPMGITDIATLATYGYGSTVLYTSYFMPTDSDYAAGFNEFGYENVSLYIGKTWFTDTVSGGGRLHLNVEESTEAHIAEFYDPKGFESPQPADYNPEAGKLGRSQFVTATDTPLRNAGLTPIAGTLDTALKYFSHQETPTVAGLAANNPIIAPCQKNFIVLVTDGLPSTDASGTTGDTEELLAEVEQKITALRSLTNDAEPGMSFDVRTFVVGFALPAESGNQLDALAVAGGTDVNGHAYLANDPDQLASQLQEIFQQISKEASSGTAAAINTNSHSSEGGVFQSMFYPLIRDAAARSIYWAGDVSGLFMDKYGRLREDTNGNHMLDDDGDNADRIVTYQQNSGSIIGFATPVGALTEKTVVTMDAAANLAGKYFFINATGGRHYYVCFNVDTMVVADTDINTSLSSDVYRQRLEVKLAVADSAESVAKKTARMLNNSMVLKATASSAQVTIETVLPGDVEDMTVGNSGLAFNITQQGGEPSSANPSHGARSDIKYLWNASDWLAAINDNDIPTQRAYASAEKKRHIITFVDYNQNGVPDSGEQQAFTVPTGSIPDSDILSFNSPNLMPLIPVSENSVGRIAELPIFNTMNPAAPNYVPGAPSGWVLGGEYMRTQIKRVVNFIRGQDQSAATLNVPGLPAGYGDVTLPAFRSRQIERGGQVRTWRLGDIVHSNPLVVDRPNRGYHQIYDDSSYGRFMEKYANRRAVVYVGANDGMLHAFNGGFYENRYDASTPPDGKADMRYLTQPKKWVVDSNNVRVLTNDGDFTPYDLGAELWAYVPYNLLGHLYWLTEPPANDDSQVNHVYYVDLEPVSYDVQIFTPDDDHPDGWGTILVGGMGFGGGRIDACVSRDWTPGAEGSCIESRPMSSAYFIFDITNPEKPPKLLTEFALPRQGYTTNTPALVFFKDKDNPSQKRFFLVFGSGPASAAGVADSAALHSAKSSQNARLYYLALNSASDFTVAGGSLAQCGTAASDECGFQTIGGDPSYISDIVTNDYNLDYKIDTLYFGSVISTPDGSLSGALRRVVTGGNDSPGAWDGDSLLIDLAAAGLKQPISAAPSTAFDDSGNLFVYFGTGRYLTAADKENNDQQAFYGVKEPRAGNGDFTWGTVSYANLYDSTNVQLQVADENGIEVTNGAGTNNSWQEFLNYVGGNFSGWMKKLRTQAELAADGVAGTAERAVNQPAISNKLFLGTTFVPTEEVCDNLGRGYLYSLYYRTGTAAMTKTGPAPASYDLGGGLPSRLTISGAFVRAQSSTGGFFEVPLPDLPLDGQTGGQSSRLNWQDMSDD